MKTWIGILCIMGISLGLIGQADACTSFRIKTTDGAVFYARTFESEIAGNTQITVIPKGTAYQGTLPDGSSKGLKWTAKYGFVGTNDFGPPLLSDGMNEKGLVVGQLLFPGYEGYQTFEPAKADQTIAQYEVATWLLSTFATVDEVRKGFGAARVCQGPVDPVAGSLPLHYTIHDAFGDSIVIEHVKGQVGVYDNPLGVLTNSPGFDWMKINLSNYVNLSARNAPELDLKGYTIHQFGQGSGMIGLPGDFSPPHRFIRMVALTQGALPVTGADKGLNLAMTIINNVDIPIGASRDKTDKGITYDRTAWTVAADLSRLRYYFRTYDNKNWHYVDLMKALGGARGIINIPTAVPLDYPDVTGTGKPLR